MNPGPKVGSLLSLESHYGLSKRQGLPLTRRSSQVLKKNQLKGSKVKCSSAAKQQDEKQQICDAGGFAIASILFTSGNVEPLIQQRTLLLGRRRNHGRISCKHDATAFTKKQDRLI